MNPLSAELYWLTLTALVTAFMWVPYIIARSQENGLPTALGTPERGYTPNAEWAHRAQRAHMNAVENLPIFAALILIVEVTGNSTPLTATAAMIYFWARVAYWAVYVIGIPGLRTLIFTAAWASTLAIAFSLLGWI